jgi:hypothetical protein
MERIWWRQSRIQGRRGVRLRGPEGGRRGQVHVGVGPILVLRGIKSDIPPVHTRTIGWRIIGQLNGSLIGIRRTVILFDKFTLRSSQCLISVGQFGERIIFLLGWCTVGTGSAAWTGKAAKISQTFRELLLRFFLWYGIFGTRFWFGLLFWFFFWYGVLRNLPLLRGRVFRGGRGWRIRLSFIVTVRLTDRGCFNRRGCLFGWRCLRFNRKDIVTLCAPDPNALTGYLLVGVALLGFNLVELYNPATLPSGLSRHR